MKDVEEKYTELLKDRERLAKVIQDAQKYLKNCAFLRMEPNKYRIQDILEGKE